MNRLVKYLTTTGFVLLSASTALSAPVGAAIGVNPEAAVDSSGSSRTLTLGADIFLGDLVKTTSGGSAEILFHDGTKLVVGPRSSLRIEDYLLREDGSAGNLVIGALSGTFRFVSGEAAKDRYKISTPTGTIGIRGTEFDFTVDGRRATQVLMYAGSTELCATNGECSVLSQTCELGEMGNGKSTSLGLTNKFDRAERKALRDNFVYGASQQQLGDTFRIASASKCLLSPLPFTAEFFATLGDQTPTQPDKPPAGSTGQPIKLADGTDAPVVTPAPVDTPALPPTESDGDCAGNSDHNPGQSQNCSH